MRTIRHLLLASFVAAISGMHARAQCAEWNDRFFGNGADDIVRAIAVFDDGSGPAMYVGGDFTHVGGGAASYIAKWDGERWHTLGSGVDLPVHALVVFDDGSGPALYAGGPFRIAGGLTVDRVAKWDGTTWSALGGGMGGFSAASVDALTVFDDGAGAALYAGGSFTTAGGVGANRIAKWDGASWSALGAGMTGFQNATSVRALATFDDGSGSALYAGGAFLTAGGGMIQHIAKWDGASWSGLSSGMDTVGFVDALTVFDDGTGAALYAGGEFSTVGGTSAAYVAKWNGSSWSPLANGTNNFVFALFPFDEGSGAELYAGGRFTSAGAVTAYGIAKWNGAAWSSVHGGVLSPGAGQVFALADFDDGDGSALFAGGYFTTAGTSRASRIAKLEGGAWSGIGGKGFNGKIQDLAVFDDGSGPKLFAAGDFDDAGTLTTRDVARWDGSNWSPLGSGLAGGSASALAIFDSGSGPALYVGGLFSNAGGVPANDIARWDGTSWSALGLGVQEGVNELAVFDDGTGTKLYAGGFFTQAGGAVANKIASWDGATWSALGTGMNGSGSTTIVHALSAFDDGSGAALYAGGKFTFAGGVSARHIAKWNGTSWSAVGGGMDALGTVRALTVFDDGSGEALYAGGEFVVAGGVGANYVAKWDGTSWSPLGSGLGDFVYALAVFDDGSGPALYAGGHFSSAGGTSANNVAKWDGSSWSGLSTGIELSTNRTNGRVFALAAFDDGQDGAADLYAGGDFDTAGGSASSSIAEWHGCPPGNAYCFGDGIDSVVTADCPCGNFGAPGRGCANSNASLGGARLIASGTTNPNTVVLTCTGVNNNTLCTFFRGPNHDPQAAVFGDGIKCINPPIFRFGQQNSGQMGNAPFTVAVPAPTELPGSTFHYAVHYRNPTAGFCDPGLFNASNGYTLEW